MGKRTKLLLVKALKPTLSVTWLVIAFCSMPSIFSQLYAETVDPLKYESYFLWAGVKPQPILENAEIIYIHGGEVWMNDNTQIIDMRAGVPRINHADIWMTLRVERIDWSEQVYDQMLTKLSRWEEKQKRFQGVQIDFDAATLNLKDYAVFLKELRRRLPERYQLSITGLMDWSAGGEASALSSLSEVVDEIVIQTYQGLDTITHYNDYLKTLNRIRFPYRIALVQGGNWAPTINFKEDKFFKGYVIFLVNSNL